MKLHELIKDQRIIKGWSQREFAKMMHVTHGAVSQWEIGKTMPKPDHIVDMCSLFGIHANTFFAPDSPYLTRIVHDADTVRLIDLTHRMTKENRSILLHIAHALAAKPVDTTNG